MITVLFLLSVVLFLYTWRLGTLTTGLSQAESASRQSSSSLDNIISDPTFAPHKLVQLGFQSAGQSGAFWMRLSSVLFALALLLFFYTLLRLWFGRLVSLLGTMLLAGTPFIILSARSATPYILLLTPIALLASYVWFSKTDKKTLAWFTLMVVLGVALYTPGTIYFVLLGSLIFRKKLVHLLAPMRSWVVISLFAIPLLFMAPIVMASIENPSVVKSLMLIPSELANSTEVMKSTAWAGLSLFWMTRDSHSLVIGRLPMLNALQIVLGLFGLYAMWTRARRELYLLIGMFVLGIITAGVFNNLLYLILSLPAACILSAAGLRYLYKEWRTVFPLNPLPKALAVLLMVTVVGLHLLIGTRYSLVAWPSTLATRSTYVIK